MPCACTEPVGTGICAVCVERGRPKWPITMLNHTHKTHKHTDTQTLEQLGFLRAETSKYYLKMKTLSEKKRRADLKSKRVSSVKQKKIV